MAEEKRKKEDKFKKFIEGVVSSSVMDKVNEAIKSLIKKGQEAIYLTQKKVVEGLVSFLILFTGLVFVFVAAALLLNEYLSLKEGWGFLIVGAFLVLVALIFSAYIKRTRLIK